MFDSVAPSNNPTPADNFVAVVEDGGLPRRDGALGFVEGGQDVVRSGGFDAGPGGFVAMANLRAHAHGAGQLGD